MAICSEMVRSGALVGAPSVSAGMEWLSASQLPARLFCANRSGLSSLLGHYSWLSSFPWQEYKLAGRSGWFEKRSICMWNDEWVFQCKHAVRYFPSNLFISFICWLIQHKYPPKKWGFWFYLKKKKSRIDQKIFLGEGMKAQDFGESYLHGSKNLAGRFCLPYLFFPSNLEMQLKISVKLHKSNADKIPLRCKMKQKPFLTST